MKISAEGVGITRIKDGVVLEVEASTEIVRKIELGNME